MLWLRLDKNHTNLKQKYRNISILILKNKTCFLPLSSSHNENNKTFTNNESRPHKQRRDILSQTSMYELEVIIDLKRER